MSVPERIWAKDGRVTEWRGNIDDDGHDPRISGCTQYINAEALAADPIAVLGRDALIKAVVDAVPDLVWDKHPDEMEWYCKHPEIDHIERGYMIILSQTTGAYTLYDGFSSRKRKLGSFKTPSTAMLKTNIHHREQLTKALGG